MCMNAAIVISPPHLRICSIAARLTPPSFHSQYPLWQKFCGAKRVHRIRGLAPASDSKREQVWVLEAENSMEGECALLDSSHLPRGMTKKA